MNIVSAVCFWSIPACTIAAFICAAVLRGKASDLATLIGLILAPLTLVRAIVLNCLISLRDLKLDLYANYIDGFLGYPANHVAAFLLQHRLAYAMAQFDYGMWQIFVVFALIVRIRRFGYQDATEQLGAFILCAVVALPIYLTIPVCGPAYGIPNFPQIYTGAVHAVSFRGIPNGIPSVHFAEAILVFWMVRGNRFTSAIGLCHLFMTGVATLGLGEHYAIDLILAVPYVFGVLRLHKYLMLKSLNMQTFSRIPLRTQVLSLLRRP